MQVNNPAGRLHQLLKKIDIKKSASDTAVQVWARMLDTETSDPHFLSRLASVLRLPWEIEKEVQSIDGINHEMYLTWVNPLKGAANQLNLNGQFHPFAQVLDQNALSLIAICDDQLTNNRPEPILKDEDRIGLRERVDELKNAVEKDESINDDILEYIKYHIGLIEQALNDYMVQGVYSVRIAAEQAIGSAVLNQDIVQKVNQSSHGAMFKMTVAALIISAINAYPNMKEISCDVAGLIGLPNLMHDEKHE